MELGVSDLYSFLQKRKFQLSIDQIGRLWYGLCCALNAAHSVNVIHFDLKPANFLLFPDSKSSCSKNNRRDTIVDSTGDRLVLKLADFGLAHNLGESRSHISDYGTAGTLLYMSPDSLHQPTVDGRKQLGKPVDIWSLGVILFQLLEAGKTPWDAYRALGDVRLALVIADPRSSKNTQIDPEEVWERLWKWSETSETALLGNSSSNRTDAAAAAAARLELEFLLRCSQRCLTFGGADRPCSEELVALCHRMHGFLLSQTCRDGIERRVAGELGVVANEGGEDRAGCGAERGEDSPLLGGSGGGAVERNKEEALKLAPVVARDVFPDWSELWERPDGAVEGALNLNDRTIPVVISADIISGSRAVDLPADRSAHQSGTSVQTTAPSDVKGGRFCLLLHDGDVYVGGVPGRVQM